MPVYKVILAFFQKKQGWSEVYYKDTEELNLEAVYDQVTPMAQKRALLLGQECTIDAVRVSREGVDNDSVLRYPVLTGLSGVEAAPPDDALLVRMGNNDNTRRRQMYLRGIYDGLGHKGGDLNNEFPPFVEHFTPWAREIVLGNYVWPSVDPDTRKAVGITTYTSNPAQFVTFLLKEPLFPPAMFGKTIRVRVSRLNGGSALNKSLLVNVIDATKCETFEPYAVFPWRFGGRILYTTLKNVRITAVSPQKIVSRQVGAPLLASRGRQKATARG